MFVKSSAIALTLVLATAGIASAQKTKPKAAPAAAAQTQSAAPTRIKQFDAWGAYSYQSGTGKVCYVLSVPTAKLPATGIDHGDNFFIVTQRPGQNISYEPQAMMGYVLKENSKVNVTIDNKTFVMFTKDKAAWVENAAQEPALVAAMKTGHSLTVTATSKKGTGTSYTYSLAGISASLKQIESCK
ncbi:invasion associated locus B family protein [Rhizobium tumorigenes]|uniref:invasion associated locus B family protein n=1 Tax=Rhizobium tumorigenes TaxID=2041385 RepID=UPI00241EAFB2|nr:invasion associated locus B family protein [Rhizobium tumorigenes]WFS00487.1 invasion associated locus B family protein [Rhizobium tumorigenes]